MYKTKFNCTRTYTSFSAMRQNGPSLIRTRPLELADTRFEFEDVNAHLFHRFPSIKHVVRTESTKTRSFIVVPSVRLKPIQSFPPLPLARESNYRNGIPRSCLFVGPAVRRDITYTTFWVTEFNECHD